MSRGTAPEAGSLCSFPPTTQRAPWHTGALGPGRSDARGQALSAERKVRIGPSSGFPEGSLRPADARRCSATRVWGTCFPRPHPVEKQLLWEPRDLGQGLHLIPERLE